MYVTSTYTLDMLNEYPVDINLHILWISMRFCLADIWISVTSLIVVFHIFVDIFNAYEEYPMNI